jgi:outer membrane protein OmpA-like peptidoglycan-associated protein
MVPIIEGGVLMNVKKGFLPVVFILIQLVPAAGIDFNYTHKEGEQYRIVSEVREEVLYNKELLFKTQILNRIGITVLAEKGNSTDLEVVFQISEQMEGQDSYTWSIEETIPLSMGIKGAYGEIPPEQYLPSVRNVPLFPEGDIAPGATWYFPAVEVHDLKPFFDIDYRVHIPFNAFYKYDGTVENDGRTYHQITIIYNIVHKIDTIAAKKVSIGWETYYPVKISGGLKQTLLWDTEAGKPHSVNEEFKIEYAMNNGDTYLFRGVSAGQAWYTVEMPKQEMQDDIIDELGDTEGVTVEETDEGISLTLENIQFKPDSAELLPSEIPKLEKIGEILLRYPDRDIMIVGHAARLGNETWLQKLSEMRANTVAEFYISRGVRDRSRIVTKGMGSRQPLGDNNTEEGRSRNRRVEIIILEN